MNVLPLKCRANRKPMPSTALSPGAWLFETARHMFGYEPCGELATHAAYGGSKPLCSRHAKELRESLRSPDSVGNLLAGRVRTEEEIAAMVEPIGVGE